MTGRIRMPIKTQPLSQMWGFDRGKPIHRHFLEQFLQSFSSDIRGNCLEFQEDSYTTRFGGTAVAKLDIIHIDDSSPHATIIADLTKPNDIPGDSFDCIICTHVLHMIFEFDKAIADFHRILRPGGVVLVASPHVSIYEAKFGESGALPRMACIWPSQSPLARNR